MTITIEINSVTNMYFSGFNREYHLVTSDTSAWGYTRESDREAELRLGKLLVIMSKT